MPLRKRLDRTSNPRPEANSPSTSHLPSQRFQCQNPRAGTIVAHHEQKQLPSAPTFRPTEEEFKNPEKFIEKIIPEVNDAGICKIIPPSSWQAPPPPYIETFLTRRQRLTRVNIDPAVTIDTTCWICEKPDETTSFTCRTCGQKYHAECGRPSLTSRPDWCLNCIGFTRGNRHTLDTFKAMSDKFMASQTSADPEHLGNEFWRQVTTNSGTLVEYGADIPSTDTDDSLDPWNLRTFAKNPAFLLHYLGSAIKGLTNPYYYVGMMWSFFCWHKEDHDLFSISYHHGGERKGWYGIPGAESKRFEQLVKNTFPEEYCLGPDLLSDLIALLPPDVIQTAQIPIYALNQHPREFVITLPRVYHCGFSYGYNITGSVNFAPPSWEVFGEFAAKERLAKGKGLCFIHEELVLKAFKQGLRRKLAAAVYRICRIEKILRETVTEKFKTKAVPGKTERCDCCMSPNFLTSFYCYQCKRTLCLDHARTLKCGHSHYEVRCHLGDDELNSYVLDGMSVSQESVPPRGPLTASCAAETAPLAAKIKRQKLVDLNERHPKDTQETIIPRLDRKTGRVPPLVQIERSTMSVEIETALHTLQRKYPFLKGPEALKRAESLVRFVFQMKVLNFQDAIFRAFEFNELEGSPVDLIPRSSSPTAQAELKSPSDQLFHELMSGQLLHSSESSEPDPSSPEAPFSEYYPSGTDDSSSESREYSLGKKKPKTLKRKMTSCDSSYEPPKQQKIVILRFQTLGYCLGHIVT